MPDDGAGPPRPGPSDRNLASHRARPGAVFGEAMANKALIRTRITARFRRDSSGAWLVSFPDIPGAHTYGRTLRAARRRIPDVLALFDVDPNRVDVQEDYELGTSALRAVGELRTARRELERAIELNRRLLKKALTELQRRMRLSTRDAGDIIGISHQRVAQLLPSRGRPSASARRKKTSAGRRRSADRAGSRLSGGGDQTVT